MTEEREKDLFVNLLRPLLLNDHQLADPAPAGWKQHPAWKAFRNDDRLVKTVLKAPKGNPTQLAYRLRQSGGSWRVIDIFYQNSISQLATRRSDFARIVSTGGAKALIAHLDQLSAKAAR